MIKKSIEELLIASGRINTQQLSECEKEKEKNGGAIPDCLIEKNFITREQLAQAYAEYASCDYIDQISEKDG